MPTKRAATALERVASGRRRRGCSTISSPGCGCINLSPTRSHDGENDPAAYSRAARGKPRLCRAADTAEGRAAGDLRCPARTGRHSALPGRPVRRGLDRELALPAERRLHHTQCHPPQSHSRPSRAGHCQRGGRGRPSRWRFHVARDRS